jgi:NAD-dependent DNA ligase
MKIKGIGKKKAEGYYHNIRTILKTCPPDRLFVAASTFEDKFISRPLFKLLLSRVPNILNMTTDDIKNYFKKNKIPGFGPAKINNAAVNIPLIRQYLDTFAKDDLIQSMEYHDQKVNELKVSGYNDLIKNKKFVLTGFNDVQFNFEDYVYNHQGRFSNKISDDVTAIINGNAQTISDKMIEGSKLKIPIYTMEEFMKQFNIPQLCTAA